MEMKMAEDQGRRPRRGGLLTLSVLSSDQSLNYVGVIMRRG